MAKTHAAEKFTGPERAAVRAIFIAIKRAWNADSNTGEEAAAVEELINIIERIRELVE